MRFQSVLWKKEIGYKYTEAQSEAVQRIVESTDVLNNLHPEWGNRNNRVTEISGKSIKFCYNVVHQCVATMLII
jgi:hypothetical protein